MLKHLAAHADDIRLRVVSGTSKLRELRLLHLAKVQVPGTELDDDFLLGRMEFTHVRRVSEAQCLSLYRGLEWLGVLCSRVSGLRSSPGETSLGTYSTAEASPIWLCVHIL